MAGLGSPLAFPVGGPFVFAPNLPPQVINFAPTPGTQITAKTPVTFDIVDDHGIASIAINVNFSNGTSEVVWAGTNFTPLYAALSVRTIIAGGFHYSIRRSGGWRHDLTISVSVLDTDGATDS